MHYRVAAGLMAALLMISCSTASPTAPTPPSPAAGNATVRISGRLIDYQTRTPVGGTMLTWRALVPNTATQTVAVSTDAGGHFDAMVPAAEPLGRYVFQIQTGPINFLSGTVRAPDKHLETDIYVNPGTCAARYGYVFDAVTRLPIAGARVSRAGVAFTDSNGYYFIDIGCVQYGYERWGIGTTLIGASHPAYTSFAQIDGRAENTSYSGVVRNDFALEPLQ